jgi:hypothetical protein
VATERTVQEKDRCHFRTTGAHIKVALAGPTKPSEVAQAPNPESLTQASQIAVCTEARLD